MDERSSLAKQYEVMFNECIKFAESTVFDVTKDPSSFDRYASLYQAKHPNTEPEDTNYEGYDNSQVYIVSEVDGFSICESKVPFIDVFSSVV